MWSPGMRSGPAVGCGRSTDLSGLRPLVLERAYVGFRSRRAGPRMAPTWLRDAVLYQVYPQSFADSNGDGIGDLRGVAQHLDYLAWLGVTAVWLNPCFASPMRDAGYDVADYLTVDPRYGDDDDLAALADQAR